MTRTMVLLGAGASRDAGLPLTTEFAVRLMDAMHRDFRADTPKVQAMNFVYGAMVNHRSERGDDPLAAVNVETMISAIRLLQHRETHEAAPFIQGWKPAVAAFRRSDSPPSHSFGRALKQGIEKAIGGRSAFAGDGLQKVIEQMIDAGRGGVANGSLYAELEQDLLLRVRELLLQPGDVHYLAPIAELASTQPSGVDVATLNYDLTLETAAAEVGISIDTAIDRWVPGTDLGFTPVDGRLNLIKVHGSIDWRRRSRRVEWNERMLGATLIERTDDFEYGDVPAIVIGDREKLATAGPTLALLQAFKTALWRADRLVAVGYSFGDDHINEVVRNWINAAPDRTITVLDPGWSWTTDWGPKRDTFAAELNRRLAGIGDRANSATAPRLHVVPEPTARGLPRALKELPDVGPVPRLALRSLEVEGVITATVTNAGRPLTSLAFSAIPLRTQRAGRWAEQIVVEHEAARPDATRSATVRLPRLDEGESVEVRLLFADLSTADRAAHLSITAIDGAGQISVDFEAPRESPGSGLQYVPPTA